MTIKEKMKPYMRAPLLSVAAIAALVFVSLAWGAGHVFAFFSLEGLLIVGGGVVGAAFMSYETADVRKALDAIVRMFKESKNEEEDLRSDMMAIIYCARLLREKGMRNLETIIAQSGLHDPFVKYGFNMAVSEYSSDDVRAMMETAASSCYERDSVPVDVLHAMASHAPAFGMIGTLVGMVAMLSHLDGDMTLIGSSLAVSFLSTLYGVLSARLIYMPAAAKLQQEVDAQRFRQHLITEGMAMLIDNKTPMFIQDRLNSFLRLETQNYVDVLGAQTPVPPMRMASAA